ncbi:MAG TPA: DinB family protein [Chloroflexia bacterium]|nr:DinB family protein [Chloroflexia bacterium]
MAAIPSDARARALADQFTQATQDLLAVAGNCSPAQWQTVCANEARTVGVLVHHLALGDRNITALITQVVAGQPPPPLTRDMLDHANARHAQEYAQVGQAETLDLLRQTSHAATDFVQALTDPQLDQTAVIPIFGPQPTSVHQLVEYLLIGHTLGHLASIQVALML